MATIFHANGKVDERAVHDGCVEMLWRGSPFEVFKPYDDEVISAPQEVRKTFYKDDSIFGYFFEDCMTLEEKILAVIEWRTK